MIHTIRQIFGLLFLFSTLSYADPVHKNIFLAIAQDQVDKIIKKPVSHKSPLEFKQAVTRYIKNTDIHCFQGMQRNSDENVSYKKELQYLFKNYGKFSAITLLSRLRSAHHTMVKQDTNSDGESYKKYEQICSALLLTCAQVFFNDARSQILNALHEVDNLIVYWRYQQQHQIKYFFNKSPIKWVVGQSQEKEVARNVAQLERKQKELYTMLGTLTGHAHLFTEAGSVYEDCYSWIAQLLDIVSCPKTSSYDSDGTRFDSIAAQLEAKIKSVGTLNHDCMSSLKSAKKPSHFVRNWMMYTTLMGISGYMVHYHSCNPQMLPAVCEKIKLSIQRIGKDVVIDPMIDLWGVFFETHSESALTNVEEKVAKIEKFAGIIEARVAELTAEDIKSLKQYSTELLDKVLARMKVLNKEEIMQDAAVGNLNKLSKLVENTPVYYYDDKVDLGIANILLMTDEILNLLQKYPELIDEGILPLLQQIGLLFADVGKIAKDLLKNNFWTIKLAAFTPLAGACFCIARTYLWATTRNYSPIRIALADINSLLIESSTHLDDHDYGKLVYLICKLRHKTTYLKDPLSNDFLIDVSKLESKQYSAPIKRGIVENMFNKYAFLGRIAG
jgi:hypothetical protein